MSLLLALQGGGTSYSLTCAAGSYSVAGQAASLKVSRKLVCAAGSYAVSGQPASLKVGRRLVCDAGSYSVVGQPATLVYTAGAAGVAYSLACSPGSYLLSGSPATLTYTSGALPAPVTGGGGGGGSKINSDAWLKKRTEFNQFFDRVVKHPVLSPEDREEIAAPLAIASTSPIDEDDDEIPAIMLLLLS